MLQEAFLGYENYIFNWMKRLDGLDKKRWVEINKYTVPAYASLASNVEKLKSRTYYTV